MSIDFEAEGLLDGLTESERAARLELLRELAAEGAGVEELRRAVAEDRLALLPVERALHSDGRYTAQEVAELVGIERAFLERDWRALGLAVPGADDRVFTDDDVEFARGVRALRDGGLPDDDLLEMARVIAVAMTQVVAGARRLIAGAYIRPGDTEREAALRFAEAARAFAPMMGPILQHVFDAHLREQLKHDAVGREEIAAGRVMGAEEVAVCFADLVGFTKLGERIPVEELGGITGRFNELAGSVAVAPVRLVKLIGDAAMLVSPRTDPLLDAALSLIEAAREEEEGFPQLRAGVARGQALPRAGDWYGRPVNIASRLTAIARPVSVLCSAEVRDSAGDGYRWSPAGSRHLKGIQGQVRMYRARRGPVSDA